MAAVICKTIGELCSALGSVACLPCKACGVGCDACGSACGDILKSPFIPYLAVTFILNIPPVYFGILSVGSPCGDIAKWLLVNAIFCVIHMIAANYIVAKIRETPAASSHNSQALAKTGLRGDAEAQTHYTNFGVQPGNEHGGANSLHRIKYVLCNDKGMAVYILVFLGWMVWLSMGIGRSLLYYEGCDDDMRGISTSISCGYMFLSVVGIAFVCSLCCLR